MARKEKKITKFSIGRFTNGAYFVFGFMISGTLYGFVYKTYYPNICKKFSFITLSEFYLKNDEFPHFRGVQSAITNIFYWFFNKNASNKIQNILDFIREVSDLPSCAFRFDSLINRERRLVLVEKHTSNCLLYNYLNLNNEKELMLLNVVANKYGSKYVIKEIYKSNIKKERDGDIYENNCTICVPSFHNEKIFVELNTYRALDSICQLLMDSTFRENGFENAFKILNNKKNQ